MKLKLRDGVFLQNVLGDYMLLADTEARRFCPCSKEINATAAFYIRMLKNGSDPELMAASASEAFGVSVERIMPGLNAFLAEMERSGYLITVP